MAKQTQLSSNIFLFFGEDDFSLRRKVDNWKSEFTKKFGSSGVILLDGSAISDFQIKEKLQSELSPSLFASKKLIIARDCLPKKADSEELAEFLLNLPSTISKDFYLVFWQTARLDGRLKFNKQFKQIATVTEFNLPHGEVLNSWIKAMSKTLGVSITDSAADLLAVFLGRDLFEEKKMAGKVIERKEAFDLWQVYSELSKLAALTSEIKPEHVQGLVRAKLPDSVFALTDQVVARNQKGAMQALENFLAFSTTDDKRSFIKILGLLSDQIRSLLVVSLLQSQGLTNDEIAEKLGWSSGRVFITSRNIKNISTQTLKNLLKELLLIDQRIKTSDTNTKLEVDLFLVRATAN